MTTTPGEGDTAPNFTALLCDGEIFRNATLQDVVGERGTVLVFYGFSFNAISLNWWKQYRRRGWHEWDDVKVIGVGRDGPYSQNEFLRSIDSPFKVFSDVDGEVARAYGLLVEREGMANASTARRTVFVLDNDRRVTYAWIADDWINPVPADEVEEAVSELP